MQKSYRNYKWGTLYFWCPYTIKQSRPIMYQLQEFERRFLVTSVYSTYSAE